MGEGLFKEKGFGWEASKENGVWQRFVRGNAWGIVQGMDSYMNSLKGGRLFLEKNCLISFSFIDSILSDSRASPYLASPPQLDG